MGSIGFKVYRAYRAFFNTFMDWGFGVWGLVIIGFGAFRAYNRVYRVQGLGLRVLAVRVKV